MNHNQRSITTQQDMAKRKLKSDKTNFIYDLLKNLHLSKKISNNLNQCRNRIYTPIQTLTIFVSQAINPDSSCQAIVNDFALKHKEVSSVSTGGYCRACQRLSEKSISDVAKEVACLSVPRK